MKIKSKKRKRTALKIVLLVLLTALFICAVEFNNYIPRNVADYYCNNIFPYVSKPLQCFNMFFQFSLTEGIVVCVFPLLAIGFIWWLVILIKKMLTKGAFRFFFKSARIFLICAIVMAILFQAMHGINYRRTKAVTELKLDTTEELTFEDYCAALRWSYLGMIEARSNLGEDYNGVAHMNNSFENNAVYANSLLDSFAEKYNVPLTKNYVRAKPVSLSHYWSYTYIVGMYDAMLCEANINTDYIDITEFPITVCHELCHAKGYASETDCNLLASLACCSSSRADFRYAGYRWIFWNLYWVTESIAEATGEIMPEYACSSEMDPVYRDEMASDYYWGKINEEVDAIRDIFSVDITETSDNVNDAFLKSNGEEEGVEAYIVPDSIYVRFYLTHIAGGENA
jgi:hypothetical protein